MTVSFETTGFPLCRLLRHAGLLWRHSYPPPHGVTAAVLLALRILLSSFFIWNCCPIDLLSYNFLARTDRKHCSPLLRHSDQAENTVICSSFVTNVHVAAIAWQRPLFTDLLPSNRLSYSCLLCSRCLALGVYFTISTNHAIPCRVNRYLPLHNTHFMNSKYLLLTLKVDQYALFRAI
jgi:hypothetical protein